MVYIQIIPRLLAYIAYFSSCWLCLLSSNNVFTVDASANINNTILPHLSNSSVSNSASFPIVITTWAFKDAASKAWTVLSSRGSALDAVEQGCSTCEELQCDRTVGYGGSPDENGETTLDAMIMDGKSHDVGAVGALRRIKGAISVARQVMERTDHTLLVGSQAADFAIMMGFLEENLTTQVSESMYAAWKAKNCQPNFWRGVEPDPKRFCGPYTRPLKVNTKQYTKKKTSYMINLNNHDTIGMVAIDDLGHIAAGTSTNGANHKIPGRVGDSPIPGSGAYVDRNVGGAAATGDGDVMMRFMPSLVAVDYLRFGLSPDDAANAALERITSFYPSFSGAVVTLSINGTYGAACYNLPDDIFHYSVGSVSLGGVEVLTVPCVDEVN